MSSISDDELYVLLGTDIALMSATGKELARTDTVLGQTMFSGLQ